MRHSLAPHTPRFRIVFSGEELRWNAKVNRRMRMLICGQREHWTHALCPDSIRSGFTQHRLSDRPWILLCEVGRSLLENNKTRSRFEVSKHARYRRTIRWLSSAALKPAGPRRSTAQRRMCKNQECGTTTRVPDPIDHSALFDSIHRAHLV